MQVRLTKEGTIVSKPGKSDKVADAKSGDVFNFHAVEIDKEKRFFKLEDYTKKGEEAWLAVHEAENAEYILAFEPESSLADEDVQPMPPRNSLGRNRAQLSPTRGTKEQTYEPLKPAATLERNLSATRRNLACSEEFADSRKLKLGSQAIDIKRNTPIQDYRPTEELSNITGWLTSFIVLPFLTSFVFVLVLKSNSSCFLFVSIFLFYHRR
jgi:hypothetical protein